MDCKTIRARERIESAKVEATEPKKLCNRTKSALSYLLNCKNVSTIYEALKELGKNILLSTTSFSHDAMCIEFTMPIGMTWSPNWPCITNVTELSTFFCSENILPDSGFTSSIAL